MDSTIHKFKESLLDKLLTYGAKRTSSTEYRIQECPYCGDRKYHLYLYINLNDDSPVKYNCFKCPFGGFLNQQTLEMLGLGDELDCPKKFKGGGKLNVSGDASTKIPKVNVSNKDNINGVCNYINERVGVIPTLEDLQYFQYIGNPKNYIDNYLGGDNYCILKDRYWFQMTNGGIIGRYKNDSVDNRWQKYKSNRIRTAGIYKIAAPIDIMKPINVVIAEGIMDVIGLYYNYKDIENCVYIAVLGSAYRKGIDYVIDHGIFGSSVNIKIFKDSNFDINKIWIDPNVRRLFKRIDIYENLAAKDCGVPADQLDIHKIILRDKNIM